MPQEPCGRPQPHDPLCTCPPPEGEDAPAGVAPPTPNTLCTRAVFVLPHRLHACSASASAIRRRASVRVPHFSHSYSYTGMGCLHLPKRAADHYIRPVRRRHQVRGGVVWVPPLRSMITNTTTATTARPSRYHPAGTPVTSTSVTLPLALISLTHAGNCSRCFCTHG